MTQYRNICFTDYDMNRDYNLDKVEYLIYGVETCPTTGREHRQGYIEFKNKISKVSDIIGTSHFERRKGTQKEAIDYCKKDGKFVEFGKPKEQGRRNDLQTIRDEIKSGTHLSQIADDHFSQWCIYNRSFEKFQQMNEIKRDWVTEVKILYGPSGTGKTRKAMEAGAVQIEWDGKFMNNYNGEDVVVFDEFEWQMMPRTTFLRLTDRYPMVVTVKGGYRNWKPRIIYITTNDMNPQVWYGGHQAYLRRVKFEYVGKPDVVIGNTNGYDHN